MRTIIYLTFWFAGGLALAVGSITHDTEIMIVALYCAIAGVYFKIED